jgi:hypothetical protein
MTLCTIQITLYTDVQTCRAGIIMLYQVPQWLPFTVYPMTAAKTIRLNITPTSLLSPYLTDNSESNTGNTHTVQQHQYH